MSFQLSLEALEARENPVGAGVADPVGVGVTTPPPSNVGSTDPAPTLPATGTTQSGTDTSSQQILENTLAAYGTTTW